MCRSVINMKIFIVLLCISLALPDDQLQQEERLDGSLRNLILQLLREQKIEEKPAITREEVEESLRDLSYRGLRKKVSSFLSDLERSANMKVLLLGLEGAGKTTLLGRLGLGAVTQSSPSPGFNIETVEYNNIALVSCDVGGRDSQRPLWREEYPNTVGLIFVVDSSDQEAFIEARDELSRLLDDDPLAGVPLLVFANKQDLPTAMGVGEVTNQLRLNMIRNRKWEIQACSALTGNGLYEGLQWLAAAAK